MDIEEEDMDKERDVDELGNGDKKEHPLADDGVASQKFKS
jgi:hypothetical protein